MHRAYAHKRTGAPVMILHDDAKIVANKPGQNPTPAVIYTDAKLCMFAMKKHRFFQEYTPASVD